MPGANPAYPGWNPAGAPPYPGWPPPQPAAGAGSGRFRPQGAGELLDGAFTLYRRNFVLLVAIAAIIQVPIAAVQLLVFQLADISSHLNSLQSILRALPNQGNVLTPAQSSQLGGDTAAALGYVALIFAVQYLVAYPLSLAATTSAVSARYLDQPTGVGAAYRAALERWRSLVGMVLCFVLLIVGLFAAAVVLTLLTGGVLFFIAGSVAMVVVGIVFIVRITLGAQAIVLEKRRAWEGIRRSWSLTAGAGWRIAGILVLLGIIQYIASLVIVLPLTAVLGSADAGTQELAGQVGRAVTAVFVAPVTLVTLTLLYYDLRIRREGFDIEMLAASL